MFVCYSNLVTVTSNLSWISDFDDSDICYWKKKIKLSVKLIIKIEPS